MAAALDDLRERGYTEAIVWSFAANDRANAFYEAQGFTRDGAERTEERFADIPSVRYRRSL
jgi:ribosomal protein S18 acetylase RimI-like enzyme